MTVGGYGYKDSNQRPDAHQGDPELTAKFPKDTRDGEETDDVGN